MKRLPTTSLAAPAFARLETLPALTKLLEHASHFNRLGEQIKQALPPALQPHIRFAQLHEGKIHLLADSPIWAAKLRMHSFTVLGEVQRLGFNGISELKVRVVRTL